jgi:hypothetical protein
MSGQRNPKPRAVKRARKRDGVRAIPYSKVKRETVEWFWEEMIPYGMLTLLVGDPGLGKSMFTLYLAAAASHEGVSSILLSAEDHKGAVIRPRLEAAEADLGLVHHVEVRRDGLEDGLRLPDDGGKLGKQIKARDARLVVVDPISAHLSEKVNSWNDQAIRLALAPLSRAAEKHGCAVVVVAHMNKASGMKTLYRTGGSIALPAAARSALLFGMDPSDPSRGRNGERILAQIKTNVGQMAPSRVCEIKTTLLPGPDLIDAPYIEVTGISPLTGDDLLAGEGGAAGPRGGAIEFLADRLAAGEVPVIELKSAAKASGHSWRTIERAKKELGVEKQRIGGKGKQGKAGGGSGRWVWRLP